MVDAGADEKCDRGGDWQEGRKEGGKEGRGKCREEGERRPLVKYKCSGEESRGVVDASGFITAALAAKTLPGLHRSQVTTG